MGEKAIEVDPMMHVAYVQLGQMKLSMATDLSKAKEVVDLYDKGLEYCRTPEELKDICSMRILTIAQIDAAGALKMETLNMQSNMRQAVEYMLEEGCGSYRKKVA